MIFPKSTETLYISYTHKLYNKFYAKANMAAARPAPSHVLLIRALALFYALHGSRSSLSKIEYQELMSIKVQYDGGQIYCATHDTALHVYCAAHYIILLHIFSRAESE